MKFSLLFILSTLIFEVYNLLDREYYDALELPVSASPQQIKDSFRKMSRKYHPDRYSGSRQKFQLINVAYETLSNPELKFIYDRVGKQKMKDPNIHQQMNLQTMKGPELPIKVFLQLKDFYLGKTLEVMIQKQVACPHCHGTGAQNPYDVVTCKQCQGKGRTTRRVQLGNGYYNLFTQTCNRCQGKGKVIGRKCHLCHSQKIISGIQEFELKVAPGTQSNSIQRYNNMGDQRLEGAPSDILFELIQISHPYFRRVNFHLYTDIYITLQEAILGFKKTIVHLDNRNIEVSADQTTQPGAVIVLQGEGMPRSKNSNQKGDMFVTVKVQIPKFNQDELDILRNLFQNKV